MTTNYEKIKLMSIDEMAEWLEEFNHNSLCLYCKGCDNEDEEIGCRKGLIQWLQDET